MISMREAYEKIGANYDDACARLMGEEMLARFGGRRRRRCVYGSAHAQGREPEPGIR